MENQTSPQSPNTQLSSSQNTPTSNLPNTTPREKPTELTPFHAIILLSIFAVIVLLIITLTQLFRKNPYGEQIKINNIEQYYKSFPNDTKDSVFNTLYNVASINNPDTKLPKSGAKIRDGSTTGNYNKNTNIYIDSFIVDIEELQQSYVFQVTWSPNQDNPYLENVSYPVLATCPKTDQIIYNSFTCIDGFSNNGIYDDPIFSILPINIAYYENNYSVYTAYDIIAEVTDDKLTIIINDKTGGNRNAALNSLKEKNINPDDYAIVYNDLSAEQTPSRAPNN